MASSTRKGSSLPPPVPWYRGRTVVLTEDDGLLRFRPLCRQPFAEVAVPSSRLVVAVAEDGGLGLQGDFAGAGHPDALVLAQLDVDDAQQIERVLASRLGLPRRPRRIREADVATIHVWTFVSIDGVLGFVSGEPPTFRRLG